jgi:hypothetical protein
LGKVSSWPPINWRKEAMRELRGRPPLSADSTAMTIPDFSHKVGGFSHYFLLYYTPPSLAPNPEKIKPHFFLEKKCCKLWQGQASFLFLLGPACPFFPPRHPTPSKKGDGVERKTDSEENFLSSGLVGLSNVLYCK